MKRREFMGKAASGAIFSTAALFGISSVSCGTSQKNKTSMKKPNILLIVSDDTGWADVGYHNSEIKTPFIDKLAREGVEFDQFYVSPVCSPTRASLLTGRPPSRFGILGPIAMRSTLALPKDTPTLAELLKNAGYSTAIAGKWHLGLRPEVGPNEYGFEYSYGYLHGQIDQYTHYYKNGDRSWHRNGEFIDEEGHATDLITNEAIRFMKEMRDRTKPFFLYVPYSVPHYPLQEEEKWTKPYEGIIDNESRRLFAASMTHMDDSIGRLLATLDELDIARDTLVIYISDNGGQENWTPTFEYDGKFAPNDRLGNNLPLRDWKASLYDGGIRVPACMYWPGRLEKQKISVPLTVCDIYPTIASLAGIAVPGNTNVEGDNIWPVVTGGSIPDNRVFYWRTGSQQAIRKGDWKMVHNGATPQEGVSELYNIAEDPYETRNLVDVNPAKLSELSKELSKQFSMDAPIGE